MIAERVKQLFDEQGYWYEHPDHPVKEWIIDVTSEHTRRGYHDWIIARIEEEEDENDEKSNGT